MADRATIFLLSPASMSGVRARQLSSPRASFLTAKRFRSTEGVPIADAFSFMSALYFRGKIAYARRFGVPDPGRVAESVLVIAPGFGLIPPDWRLTPERMKKLSRTPVDARSRAYRAPLVRDARALAATLEPRDQVVLLGSIATGKYLDLLRPVFGAQLLFPRCFVGIGDMSRGALMLRAAASGEEFDYAALDSEQHRPRRERA